MDFIMYKNKVDEYYTTHYDKLTEISDNIQRKSFGKSEHKDSLVILCYEYMISNPDKCIPTLIKKYKRTDTQNIESIVVNWMYKQCIWKGTTFKKDFIYKKELPIKIKDNGDQYDIEDDSIDIEDLLEEEFEYQKKISHVKAMVESLDYVDYKLYHLVFTDGYNNSGKLSRYTGIPRCTSWVLIKDLKNKLKNGYDT